MVRRHHDRLGFTLAELLITIAIIGVLAAFSIPLFASQLDKARQSAALQEYRTIYSAAQYGLIDWQKDHTKVNTSGNDKRDLEAMMEPYMDGMKHVTGPGQIRDKSHDNCFEIGTGTPQSWDFETKYLTYKNRAIIYVNPSDCSLRVIYYLSKDGIYWITADYREGRQSITAYNRKTKETTVIS
jgi:prepilin-type N-terminal cleavage/methylation domain-containing protein